MINYNFGDLISIRNPYAKIEQNKFKLIIGKLIITWNLHNFKSLNNINEKNIIVSPEIITDVISSEHNYDLFFNKTIVIITIYSRTLHFIDVIYNQEANNLTFQVRHHLKRFVKTIEYDNIKDCNIINIQKLFELIKNNPKIISIENFNIRKEIKIFYNYNTYAKPLELIIKL
jgi:hypothetical protein